VSNCHSAGTVIVWDSNDLFYSYAGGLVGYLDSGTISNCYATGVVSSPSNVGGLVGYIFSGTISNCYSTGAVSGSNVGGLVGYKIIGSIVSSFWDVNTSGQATSAGGTGKTTAQMQDINTFLNAGWDFTTPIWKICDGTNYPKLAWQESLTGDFACPDGVDIYDLAIFIDQWLLQGDYIADIAPAPGGDGIVNMLDFAAFAENWLVGQ
jgi:hypothetical protein